MGIGKASSGNDAITLSNNGALVNDQKVVSEERACYFSTVADEIGGRDNLSFSEDDFTLHPSVINIKHNQPNCDLSFFTEITVEDNIKSLENLNTSKSTGWDLIPSRVLKLQSSSKVLGRLPFLPLLFLPPPAPGPMLIKTLMFVRVIVLLYPNIEQGGRGIFSKRENSLFSGLKWTTVKLYNLPNYFCL